MTAIIVPSIPELFMIHRRHSVPDNIVFLHSDNFLGLLGKDHFETMSIKHPFCNNVLVSNRLINVSDADYPYLKKNIFHNLFQINFI